jgi:hypothetical protein
MRPFGSSLETSIADNVASVDPVGSLDLFGISCAFQVLVGAIEARWGQEVAKGTDEA